MKKYCVHPGHVISKKDGDRHYITFLRLCQLYNVDPEECVNANSLSSRLGYNTDEMVHLKVRHNGNYSLPKEK
uniref:Uncharacterized protein n=1 Tax=viral metagenome TaxID=1070528 RepID=A0A6M3J1B7_9ZZZZ